MEPLAAIVMAGGRGVRMRSSVTKMLMPILGRPLVFFPTRLALEAVSGAVVVVSGEQLPDVQASLSSLLDPERLRFARQEQPLGTADAVKAGMAALAGDPSDHVLILNGDVPATTPRLIGRFLDRHFSRQAAVSVLGFKPEDPTGYGRVIYDDSGRVLGIKEQKELAPEEEDLDVVNAGIYVVARRVLEPFLAKVKPSPNQREYLLTDIVSFAVEQGGRAHVLVARDEGEVAGVNNRAQLAEVGRRIRAHRNEELMLQGVGMPLPDSVTVDFGVTVGEDTVLEPNVRLCGKTAVGTGCRIGQGSVVDGCTLGDNVLVKPYCVLEESRFHEACTIGPFAHTRPGSVIHRKAKVGNFVETKKTILGEGAKASHLTYLGDAEIGPGVNIGAGTITCNYDGYRKYPTIIEEGAFVGSDTQFVAPVRIGARAVVGAGTTVTRDVPAESLVTSRVEQTVRRGYYEKKRQRMQDDKKE